MIRSSDKKLDNILKFYYPNFKEYNFQKKLDTNIFLIESKGEQYVIKAYDKKLTKKRLLFFEELQNMTNTQMQISPLVVRTNDGSLNVNVDGFYYDVAEFVKGETLLREQINEISDFFYKIGFFVGKLHKSFLEIEKLNKNAMESLLHIEPESPKHLIALLKNYQKARIEKMWKDILKRKIEIVNIYANDIEMFKILPRKIVHGDIYLKNIIFNNAQEIIGLIDFYQAGIFFRCYEVMRVLVQINILFQTTEIAPQHTECYLKGYFQNNTLNEIEIRNMLDFYIYVQASDVAFLDIETITNGGKEINKYAKYRAKSLNSLFINRRLLNNTIYKFV